MIKRILCVFVLVCLFPASVAWAGGTLQVKVTPVPPNLAATVAFSEPSGNNILDADETGKIIVTLQNRGKGDAFDVRAELKTAGKTAGISFDREVLIGTVPAGGVVKKEIAIKASEDTPTTKIALTVDIKEANGFDPNPVLVSFQTKAFNRRSSLSPIWESTTRRAAAACRLWTSSN